MILFVEANAQTWLELKRKFRKMMSSRVDESGISMYPLERGAESSRSF